MFSTIGFILIAIFASTLFFAGSWLEQNGRERKEQGKRNWLRPIIVVVASAIGLIILIGAIR